MSVRVKVKYQWCSRCNSISETCSCDDNSKWKITPCKKCGGSGEMSWNPADMMIAPPKDMAAGDLIKVVNPEMSIPEFHKKNVEDCYNGIMRALYQMYIDEAQSGKAKEKDMEGQYLFLQKLSDGVFGLIENILIDILSLRSTSTSNGKVTINPSQYVIVKPTQFAIKTEKDLLDEYQVSTTAKLPDFIKARQLTELLDKLYGGDYVMQRKTKLIIQMDVLAVTSEQDKLAKVNGGALPARDWQFNSCLPNILDGIVRDKGSEWFLEAPYDVIKTMVDGAFKLILPVELHKPVALPGDKIPNLS